MQSGPTGRKRGSQRKYFNYLKNVSEDCSFCTFSTGEYSQVKERFTNFILIENAFKYDHWDGEGVSEHIMIIPKRHIESINEMIDSEANEYIKLVGLYENMGYSIYARSKHNKEKSVNHQHTHLIKLDGSHKKILFYIRKPHFLLYY